MRGRGVSRRGARAALAGGLVLWGAGCASEPAAAPRGGPMEVAVGSQGRVFASGSSQAAAALVSRVKQRLEQRRLDEAQELAARYPRELLEVLSEAGPSSARDPLYVLLARVRDRLDGAPRAEGWEAHLVAMSQAPEVWETYANARRARREQLRRRAWDEALSASVPRLAGPLADYRAGEALRDEAAALEGLAEQASGGRRDEEPPAELAEAAEKLEQAERALARVAPDLGLRARLARAALARRRGRAEEASALWRSCLAAASELLARQPPLCDVDAWEELLAQRPAGEPWPSGLLALARRRAELQLGASEAGDPAAAALWAALGAWRGARRDFREALRAYLKAEEACGSPAGREALRLEQARLMIRLEETGAAASVLGGLAASPRSEVAAPALALLGSIHLKREQLREAAHLLRQAVGEGSPVGFRGRGEAEADLGLAELLLGHEEPGLRWLRSAQERFRAQGARRQLERALRNELRYHEFSQHPAEAQRLKSELTALARGAD